uniref:Uncharacterized protein LOC105032816 isoform X2 n=1 Tax=Elaeis guineensis var. tenera TaxID=51953 RepID=A0A6J0PD72_ELAGV|nr:uncharacterized protein LOC105032816 isoform X2 [Elaeis guineensis]
MEAKLSRVSQTLTPSPIQELSHLAQRCGAINLAEGFPDFPAPPHVKEAAISAINADLNQYRHVQGICDLLAATMRQNYGLEVNPLTDVVICCGQSEAFAAAIFATINQGDEVLLFDPAYETYESCIALAGGIPVYVPLDPPYWTLNVDKLMKSFTSRTKAVVLNRLVQKKLIDIGTVLTIQLEKFSVRKNFRPLLELAAKWTALLLQTKYMSI